MLSGEVHIHERFFRHIWCNQYLRTVDLRTTEGKSVQVSDPGTLNPFGGPDVRDAVVAIGNITYIGDIEIHRSTGDWSQHGHDTNTAYNKVILHVVLQKSDAPPPTLTASGRTVPVLVLEPFLREPLHSLLQQIMHDEATRASDDIPCRFRNAAVDADTLLQWISKLAQERLETKIHRFDDRLRELAMSSARMLHEPRRQYSRPRIEGFPEEIPLPEPTLPPGALSSRKLWDQVLYEGLMDGLGYSRNRQPFLRLAQIASLDRVRDLGIAADPLRISSLLFGISGLLPAVRSLGSAESRAYARVLRREWKQIRNTVRCEQLHQADWHFFPTRPGNFPTLRIAAASILIQNILTRDLFRRIIQTVAEPGEPRKNLSLLRSSLHTTPDPFWIGHYHFDRPRRRTGVAVGKGRLDDLLANTVLPLCLLYARIFHDRNVRQGALALYEGYPPLTSNMILRTMEKQLLLGKVPLDSMRIQQGVIHLHTSYCRQGRCGQCEIGRIVF